MILLDEDKNYHPIGELCQVIDCEHKTAPYVDSSDYLVVRTSNVRNGSLILDDIKYTTRAGFEEWTQRAVPEYGDVLFTREAPAGESCLVPKDASLCIGQRMVLLRPNPDKLDAHFLSFYLISQQCKREIDRYSIGSTVTRINIEDILKINILSPPLVKQKKIASFLGAVDARLGQLRRKHELLQTYKRGVMQQLFSQQIRFKQDDGTPFPDWEYKDMGDLFDWIKTNSLSRDALNYTSGTVKNIHYGDIHGKFKSHFRTRNEEVPYITSEEFACELEDEVFCQVGDLVIADASEDYADIGKAIEIIEVEVKSLVAGLHCLMARPRKDIFIVGFPGHLFQVNKIRNQIRRIAQGVSVLGISKANLEGIRLPNIHRQEQRKIVDFLAAIDLKIEAISREIEHLEQFKKGLLQKMFV